MKMKKLIRESLFDTRFNDGPVDIMKDLNLGFQNKVYKEITDLGYKKENIKFVDYKLFFYKPESGSDVIYKIVDLQIKYFPKIEGEIMRRFFYTSDSISDIMDEAIEAGLSIEKAIVIMDDCIRRISYSHKTRSRDKKYNESSYELYKKKINRTNAQIKEDNENNIYVFIGFIDKVPVTIDGEKYYKDKFNTESIVKIDKYSLSDLNVIQMMNIRARAQYGRDGDVYTITIPKYLMDDDTYSSIPEHLYEIFVNYKQRI